MSNTETGGQAFPLHPEVRPEIDAEWNGMTLRDYFAAKAMQGFAADPNMGARQAKEIALLAYVWADSMLEARK